MTAPELVEPRKRLPSGRTRKKAERWSWIFMRVSGVVLMVLIFTHLIGNLVVGDGINRIDFAFVAGKWASPIWQIWAALMLWLGMIHGFNGMRLLRRPRERGSLARQVRRQGRPELLRPL